MSVFFNNALAGASGQGGATYKIERSLRFNSADSAHLSRSVTSAGNRKTWTWSGWVKKTYTQALTDGLFTSGTNANNNLYIGFGYAAYDDLIVINRVGGVDTMLRATSGVYRDPAAWMHIVVAVDTTQATAADRIKLYVNGAQVSTSNTNPTLNQDLEANQASSTTYIGRTFAASTYPDCYLADIHFIDGQALTPSSFGEFDTNGVWQPKAYSGSYGTNGFRLDFSDNSAATATTLGKDRSPNGNNFTPNNLSVTAGAGNDSLVDSPTNYGTDTGVGGEVRGNYATWNLVKIYSSGGTTYANGNLEASLNTTNTAAFSTIGMSSGKWYWEMRYTGSTFGACGALYNDMASQSSNVYFFGTLNADVGFRYDADANLYEYTTNGSTWTTISTASLTQRPVFAVALSTENSTKTAIVNFGQRPFTYTAPSGYKALCTQNLPTPTITKGNTAMDVVLYTGTGAALTPTSTLGFSPDFVWIKSRSAATDHALYDTVRGVEKRLESNTGDAQVTSDGGVTAFNSAGFTVGTLAQVNTNAATYAAWCWDGGSSTVTNTSGSTSSQVRANTSAGFSVVTYTGTGANATVGHGLGVAPQLMLVKITSNAVNWAVYHASVGNTQFLELNTTTGAQTLASAWNNTSPTSSVFSLGSSSNVNAVSNTYVAFCFAPVAGYSAFGSYYGNANVDGPGIALNFRPEWILIKRYSSGADNWVIIDAARKGYNVDNDPLYPNLSNAEGITDLVDILGNGFKLRTTDTSVNAGLGNTYMYAAFAEHPLKYSRAR